MFKGFKLTDSLQNYIASNYGKYHLTGLKIYKENGEKIKNSLDDFYLNNNVIDGRNLKELWFPNIKADVFLSHSHADEQDTIAFAGFLKIEFGFDCFIDSTVWGYASHLLREIDDKYCKHSNEVSYDYDKRNYSTSHIHMMLNMSLLEMIDSTECVIFVHTPNSIEQAVTTINSGTYSPWIYSELNMTKYIRINPPKRFLEKTASNQEKRFEVINESLKIIYDVESPLDNLIDLNKEHINMLLNARKFNKANYIESINHQNLDRLYEICN